MVKGYPKFSYVKIVIPKGALLELMPGFKNTSGEYELPLWEDALSVKSNQPEQVLSKDGLYCPVGPTTGWLCINYYISHEVLSMSSRPHNTQQSKLL